MKKIIYTILPIIAILVLTGCPDDPIIGGLRRVFSKHFILQYENIGYADLRQDFETDSNNIVIEIELGVNSRQYEFAGIGATKLREKWDSVAILHGDTAWDRIVLIECDPWLGPYHPHALLNEVTAIDITSAQAWDARHPAGSSLADIVRLKTQSYKQYIRSGYDDSILEDPIDPIDQDDYRTRLMWQEMLLSDMAVEDFELTMYYKNYLIFTTPPDHPGQYDITVTIHTEDGKEFVKSCSVNATE